MNKTLKTVIGASIAIGLMLLAVAIFTKNSIIPAFYLSDKPGEIGDAINGMTAPIIALISAGLLFWSFQAQIEANKLIQAQWQFDNFQRQYEKLQEKIETVLYSEPIGHAFVEYKLDNISVLLSRAKVEIELKKDLVKKIFDILSELDAYLYLIGDKNNIHRDYFFEKIHNLYLRRLNEPIFLINQAIEKEIQLPFTDLKLRIQFLRNDIKKIDDYEIEQSKKLKAKRQKNRKRLDSRYYKFLKPFYNMEKKNLFDLDEF